MSKKINIKELIKKIDKSIKINNKLVDLDKLISLYTKTKKFIIKLDKNKYDLIYQLYYLM